VLTHSGAVPSSHVIEQVTKQWSNVLTVLNERFPSYKICWKAHPITLRNGPLQKIGESLERTHPFLKLLDPKGNANKLMLKAKYIISDVSSVLWWGSFMQGKKSLSLDLFNYEGGDEMKDRSNVIYCNNISDIAKNLVENRYSNSSIVRPKLNAVLRTII